MSGSVDGRDSPVGVATSMKATVFVDSPDCADGGSGWGSRE